MVIALIVAGGQGLRMQTAVRKQYLLLNGRPVLHHTLRVFDRTTVINRIVLVVPSSDLDFCRRTLVPEACPARDVLVVEGGAERRQSVYNGLCAMDAAPDDIVVIHDGVRPFVEPGHIDDCVRNARETGAAILAVPVSDTIKRADEAGNTAQTIDRLNLWAAQTPQAFRYCLIRSAHDDAARRNLTATDDAALLDMQGRSVKLVHGSRNNIKITTPEDLLLAEALMNLGRK
ncbi:2-C-methyl-D-erythritol 4-phosphate cytidylyltransferase [Desulfatiferula olefinivorans]